MNNIVPMTTGPYAHVFLENIPSWYLRWLMDMYPTELLPGVYDAIEVEYDWRTVSKSHWDDAR